MKKKLKPKSANVKALAEMQTKEIEEVTKDFEIFRDQLTALEKLNLISETDYRNLPDELKRPYYCWYGWRLRLKILLRRN